MISHSPRVGIRPFAFALALVVAGAVTLGMPGVARAAVEPAVGLGTAAAFGVLGGETVTNTGASIVDGLDVGVSPGSAIVGFPPGLVIPPGSLHAADPTAANAKADALIAYTDAAGRSPAPADQGLTDLSGKTLTPGVYQGNLSLTGTVTLDNNSNPDAVFIFQASSTLITASSSVVTFTNKGHPSCNVFWQVGSSATLGTDSNFVGTVLAHTSVSAANGATITGRLLASTGAVTLDNNTIHAPVCALAPPTTSTSATATTTPGSSTPAGSSTSTPGTTPPAPNENTTPSTLSLLTTTPGVPSVGNSSRITTTARSTSAAAIVTTALTQPSFPTGVPGGSGPIAPISPLRILGAILAVVGALLLMWRIPATRRLAGRLSGVLRLSHGNPNGEHQ